MSATLTQHLLGAPVVLERGIKNANFFNGRVLTARDLQDEQLANRQQHGQLGRSIGVGVAHGMEVRLVSPGAPGAPPVLAVQRGLAISRNGQGIELDADQVHVALARKLPALAEAGLFADCEPLQSAPDLVGKGVYMFTIAPASTYRDQAPMVSLNGGGKADGCGDRYAVEGAVFRLFELPLATLGGVSQTAREELVSLLSQSEQVSLTELARATARSRLRNLLVHACFGTEQLAERAADPLSVPADRNAGALDALRADGLLSDCEAPLALLVWTSAGVRFVDMWAVRRMLTPSRELAPFAPWSAAPSIIAAMVAQHHEHVADLVTTHQAAGLLGAMRARELFRYLPPCGILPVAHPGQPGPPIGFVPEQFFDGVPARPQVYIEGGLIEGLYHDALACPPLDLQGGEFCWLYRTRENSQAVENSATIRPALYFAHGSLDYRGDARINLARWSYSHFAATPVY